ncbi:MAG: AMP-binding protein, partial [Verrucomicrobiota bacterium]
MSTHLLDRIDYWATVCPNRVAVQSGSQTITWQDLITRANTLAVWLHQEFASVPGPVAVRGHKEPEMLVAFLAAVKSGRAYVPMDASIPEQRTAKIIEGSAAVVVLTPERVQEIISQTPRKETTPLKRVQQDDPFYLLFTSGSTGEPKGVVITLRNLTAFTDWLLAEHEFTAQGEVFLNQAPFSFDLSVMDLYGSLLTGGTLA